MGAQILVSGPSGRMGRAVLALLEGAAEDQLIGVIADEQVTVSTGHPQAAVFDDVASASSAEVLVDFTAPAATVGFAPACAARGVALVTGTTGLDADEQAAVRAAADTVPVVQAGNFSLGINLLMALVEQAAQRLSDYDIEILEAHHRRKIDAPSGTALMLGEAAARGANVSLSERAVFERYGQVGPRKEGEIGFSVLRGGGVHGDHDVSFLSEEEIVTLSHRAMDRALFARGALAAARWVVGKPPGLYTMRDVLEI